MTTWTDSGFICPDCDSPLVFSGSFAHCPRCAAVEYDHSHLCPLCFREVPCDMDCSTGELKDSKGLWTAHPVVCDDCGNPDRMLELGFDPIAMGM